MGCGDSKQTTAVKSSTTKSSLPANSSVNANASLKKEDGPSNDHIVNKDIKTHISFQPVLDHNHQDSLKRPLSEVTDEHLIVELKARKVPLESIESLRSQHLSQKSNGSVSERSINRSISLADADDTTVILEILERSIDLLDDVDQDMVKRIYDIGTQIGKGTSGHVYECTHKTTGTKYALKVIEKNDNINDMESMSTEIEIMKRVRHENVVSLNEIFESPTCIWFILDYIDGGNLRAYYKANSKIFTETMVAILAKQILAGVSYLHTMGIVHRDIKLENILLKKNVELEENEEMSPATMLRAFTVKVADFGLSALVRVGEDAGYDALVSKRRKDYTKLHEPWGTPENEAPEVLLEEYGPQADIWSVGTVLFELLSGKKAFKRRPDETSLQPLYGRILRGEYNMNGPEWSNISQDGKNFISKLLVVEPKTRLCGSEAVDHLWIRKHFRRATVDGKKYADEGISAQMTSESIQ